mmetsp:Transcript_7846/g.23163  ORF Transcript_7846/g.23163 Transcript_7846/m.23163 type:complete len:208 (+) Transcript_7846:1707-2330(+)
MECDRPHPSTVLLFPVVILWQQLVTVHEVLIQFVYVCHIDVGNEDVITAIPCVVTIAAVSAAVGARRLTILGVCLAGDVNVCAQNVGASFSDRLLLRSSCSAVLHHHAQLPKLQAESLVIVSAADIRAVGGDVVSEECGNSRLVGPGHVHHHHCIKLVVHLVHGQQPVKKGRQVDVADVAVRHPLASQRRHLLLLLAICSRRMQKQS